MLLGIGGQTMIEDMLVWAWRRGGRGVSVEEKVCIYQ